MRSNLPQNTQDEIRLPTDIAVDVVRKLSRQRLLQLTIGPSHLRMGPEVVTDCERIE